MTQHTIIKVGTGVLTKDDGTLDEATIVKLVTQIAGLKKRGVPVILVSSGAVGAGVPLLGLQGYPEDIPTRQAAAAVGQAHLIKAYDGVLSHFGLHAAQVLLSSLDLKEAKHQLRVQAVFEHLLENPQVVPVVNENDVVSLRELTKTDNDMLAANLAVLSGASTLILLTSVDGLIHSQTQEVISEVTDLDTVFGFANQSSGKFSIGGMVSKLEAVRIATDAGVRTIIGNGNQPERLERYHDQGAIGTYFQPKRQTANAKV